MTSLVVPWLIAATLPQAAKAQIGCPPAHKGRPLADLELFDGSPSNKIAVRPENGRFVVPQTPRSQWGRFPPSTLGCRYQGLENIVTVALPRHIRVCDFTNGPNVRCR